MRELDQRLKNGGTYAAATPLLHHRHAADLTAGLEPARSDGLAFVARREHVIGVLVSLVPLETFGYFLFFDENLAPHRVELVATGLPVHGPHDKR